MYGVEKMDWELGPRSCKTGVAESETQKPIRAFFLTFPFVTLGSHVVGDRT
jgi:hypothetical protein